MSTRRSSNTGSKRGIDDDEITTTKSSTTRKSLTTATTTKKTTPTSTTTTTKFINSSSSTKLPAKPSTKWLSAKAGEEGTGEPVKRKQRPASSSSSSYSSNDSSNSSYSSSTQSPTSSSDSSDFASSADDYDDKKKNKGGKTTTKMTKAQTNKRAKANTNSTSSSTAHSIRDIEDYIPVTIIDGNGSSMNAKNDKLLPKLSQRYIDIVTQYLLLRDLRHEPTSPAYNAPVDTMGCAMTGDKTGDPKTFRFETLVSLMLSAQTKDAVTFDAVGQLRTRLSGGCTPNGILSEQELAHDCIKKVGFHNTKIQNLIKVAKICKDQYNNDIPRTLQGLLDFPGVGPKMGNLTMHAAWGESVGIGVDVHVHRIVNMLGWLEKETNTPEKTRLGLEKVLPPQYFSEINWILVGFGQTVCPSRSPKCGQCVLAKTLMCPVSGVKYDVRKEYDQSAQQYYNQHLTGSITPISALIETYFQSHLDERDEANRIMGNDNRKVPTELNRILRQALVQKALVEDYNITPERLRSFLTDKPPLTPGEIRPDQEGDNDGDKH